MSTNDALNQAQVERRRTLPVDAVVAELRDVTPRAIDARAHIRWWARQVRLPVPPAGMMRLDKLLVEIFPRDMWIHRLDIADATGRPFEQRAEHDGVLLEQVVADTAYLVHKRGGGVNLNLRLAGPAGGAWNVASPGAEEVNLSMEATDFMRLSSGRTSVDGVLERVSSDAQPTATRRILALLVAPY
jgi:uncharacterized protein (TIGR03083 family)